MLKKRNSGNKEFAADSLNDSLSDNSVRQIKKKKGADDYFEDSLQDAEEQFYMDRYNGENLSFYSEQEKPDLRFPEKLASDNDSLQSKRNSFGSSNVNTSGVLLPNPYPKKGGSRSSSVRQSRRSRHHSHSSLRRDSQEGRENPSFNGSRRNSNLSEEFKEYCRSIQGKDIYHRVDDISKEYEQRVLKDFKKIGENIPELRNNKLLILKTDPKAKAKALDALDARQTEKMDEDKAYLASVSSGGEQLLISKERTNGGSANLDRLLEDFISSRSKKPEQKKPESKRAEPSKEQDIATCDRLLRPESARSIPEGSRICVEHETPGFLNPGRASKEFSCIQEEEDLEDRSRLHESNLGKRGRLLWNTSNNMQTYSPLRNSNNDLLEYSPPSNSKTSPFHSGSAKRNRSGGNEGASESVSSLKGYLKLSKHENTSTSEKAADRLAKSAHGQKEAQREVEEDDEQESRIRAATFEDERVRDLEFCNSDSILRKYLGKNFSPEQDSSKKHSDHKIFVDISKLNKDMKQRLKHSQGARQESPARKKENSTMSLSKGDISSENPANFLLSSYNGRLSPLLQENLSDIKKDRIGSGKEIIKISPKLNASSLSTRSVKEKENALESHSKQSRLTSPQSLKVADTQKLRDQVLQEKITELEKDALLYMKTENFKIALEKLLKADQTIDSLSGGNPEHKCYVNYLTAELYSRVGNLEGSEYYCQKGLKLSETQSINNSAFLIYTFQMYAILVSIHSAKENFELSLDFLNKMMTILNLVQGKQEIDSYEKLLLDQTELLYFNLGEVYQKKADYAQSLEIFQDLLEVMENRGSEPKRKLEVLQMIAKNCKNLDLKDQLQETLKTALEILKVSSGSAEITAYFYESYASCLENNHQYAEAANYRESALKKKMETTGMNNTHTALALLNVAKAYYQGRDFENASRCLSFACSIFEHLYGKVNLYSGNCLVFMAQIAFFQVNYKAALESYSAALSIYSTVLGGEHEHTLRLYLNIVHVSGIVGDLDRMQSARLRLEELAVKRQTFEGMVLLNELGNLLRRHGEYNESERLYLKSIELFQVLPDKDTRLRTLTMLISNLAGLYVLKKEFSESINCYRKALLISKDFADDGQISAAHILLNLARVYKRVNRYNDAEFYLRQAEKICRERKKTDTDLYAEIKKDINAF